MEEHVTDQRPQADDTQTITILTTEHNNLQNSRSATIFEANGRTTLYLTSVSSAVVALAFIGQVSEMSQPFMIFALILLPTLLFMGIVTFVRVIETGLEDMICHRGINRIRHYYTEVAPHLKDYFILSTHDDMKGYLQNMGATNSPWQILLSTAGLVAVINGILAGVFVALLLSIFISESILVYIIVGIVVLIVSVYVHVRVNGHLYLNVENRLHIRFPSDESQKK